MAFKWDVDNDQTYHYNDGDAQGYAIQQGTGSDFDKAQGKTFTMDAPGGELKLSINVPSHQSPVTFWLVEGDTDETTTFKFSVGAFNFLSHDYVGDNTLFIGGIKGGLPVDIDITGSVFIETAGIIFSPSSFGVEPLTRMNIYDGFCRMTAKILTSLLH